MVHLRFWREGVVAYKLELPGDARIHPVFHVSLLKQIVGADVITQSQLPSVSKTNGEMIPNPQAVLDRRLQKGRAGILIHWHGSRRQMQHGRILILLKINFQSDV